MLRTNLIYTNFNMIFILLSLAIGLVSILWIKNAKEFKGLFFWILGEIIIFTINYITKDMRVFYDFGVSDNLIMLTKLLLILLISLMWINASNEIYNNKSCSSIFFLSFISIFLPLITFYSVIGYKQNICNYIANFLIIFSSLLLIISIGIKTIKNRNLGNILLLFSAILFGLNLHEIKIPFIQDNILCQIWICLFILSIFFIKINQYQHELTISYSVNERLNDQFRKMVQYSPFPIIISRLTDKKILLINNKTSDLFDVNSKDINYYKLNDFLVDEENRKKLYAILENKHEVQDFDLMVCNIISGTPFWLSVSANTFEYNNEMALYLAFQNITSRKERETKLQNQADKDPLTLAWNRRYFEKEVVNKIKESIENHKTYSLLMIDADKFKNVNDTYGHKAGDKVLIEIANTCKRSLRECDIVCRYGGEEFVIYLDDVDEESTKSVAERLRKNIESTVIEDEGKNIKCTVSIGYVFSKSTDSLDILIRRADDAMYYAKQNGRNRCEAYDENNVHHKKKSSKSDVHPIFENEENEEVSLLDSYENKIL